MKTNDLVFLAERKAISIEDFNTNNAWGFGGGFGKQYNFSDGSYLKIGTACYRHLPSHIFTAYYYADESLWRTEDNAEIENILVSLKK